MSRFRRNPLRFAASIALTLLVAGCSAPQTVSEDTGEGQQVSETAAAPDSQAPTKEAGGAKLEKAGIGQEDDYAWVTAVVSNTSADNIGRFVTVQFNMTNAKGKLVASQDQVEQFTSANQTLAIGTQIDLDHKIKVAKVEATLGMDDPLSMDDLPNLPVGRITIKEDKYEGPQASFEVKNPTKAAQKSARIGVVCFNKSSKIIGGGSGYPDLIPANGRVLVKVDVMTSGKPDTCEAYAAPSSF